MRISLVGGGAMGGALLNGWLAAGHRAQDIQVVEPDAGRAEQLREQYGVRIEKLETLRPGEAVVVAVKPHHVVEVLSGLSGGLASETLVVSIAAGVSLSTLQDALPKDQPVFRVMPNTPALLGKGMTGIAPGAATEPAHVDKVTELLEAVGKVRVVEEKDMDALTALSGSGPAYLFYVADAMIEAGVHQGLTRDEAATLVNQTFVGAAAMLSEAGDSASVLRERVTSPAGTTAAALRALDDHGVRAGFLAAVEACVQRSRQL